MSVCLIRKVRRRSILVFVVLVIVEIVAVYIDGEYGRFLLGNGGLYRLNDDIVGGDDAEQRPVGMPHTPLTTEEQIYRSDDDYDWKLRRIALCDRIESAANDKRNGKQQPTRMPQIAKKTYEKICESTEQKGYAVYDIRSKSDLL